MRITHAQREVKASLLPVPNLLNQKTLIEHPPLFTQTLPYLPDIPYLNGSPAVSAFRAVIKLGTGTNQ